MRHLLAIVLLCAACAPMPTPQELLAAHYEADEDFAPKSSEEWVAWANAMLPAEQPPGAGMRGSPTKGDVFLLDVQDRSREVDRALIVKRTKPEEWPTYTLQPHFVWLVIAVKEYVADEAAFMARLRLTNNPTYSIAESKRIFAQFLEFLKEI